MPSGMARNIWTAKATDKASRVAEKVNYSTASPCFGIAFQARRETYSVVAEKPSHMMNGCSKWNDTAMVATRTSNVMAKSDPEISRVIPLNENMTISSVATEEIVMARPDGLRSGC